MSDQEREKVVVPYADLQKEIEIVLLSRPQDNFHVKALQTTLCSMEPMVYDLDECVKGSPCHKNIEEFLSLVKEANKFISSNKNKLQTTRIKLKDLFKKHVEMELDAAGSIEVADGQVEMELKRLVRYLASTIRLKLAGDTSKLPALRNIDIILDNLKQDSGGKDAQLKLLNQVKVLLKFFKGDHGIEIPKLLLNCEKWLRKDFVTEEGLSELKKLDQEDKEKIIMELTGWFIIIGGIAFAYAFQNKSLNAFFIGAGCFIFAFADMFLDGSSSNSTNSSYQKNLKERKKYDIFLNFRGEEQRKGFAGILHYSLEKENISTFFDVTSIPKSKVFWEEIRKGINNSIGAITIFSEGYTESVDCLDELVLISDRGKESETYKITPVFYDIPTTDLEPESESKFRADLKNHDKEDKLVQWEAAIAHVASINGHTYNSKSLEMYKLVDAIVEDYKKYV